MDCYKLFIRDTVTARGNGGARLPWPPENIIILIFINNDTVLSWQSVDLKWFYLNAYASQGPLSGTRIVAVTARAEGVTAWGQKYLYYTAAASFELVYIIYFIILVEKP